MALGSGGRSGRSAVRGCLCGERARRVCGDLPGAGLYWTRARCPRESFPAEVSELFCRQVCEGRGILGCTRVSGCLHQAGCLSTSWCEAWERVAHISLLPGKIASLRMQRKGEEAEVRARWLEYGSGAGQLPFGLFFTKLGWGCGVRAPPFLSGEQ